MYESKLVGQKSVYFTLSENIILLWAVDLETIQNVEVLTSRRFDQNASPLLIIIIHNSMASALLSVCLQ